MGPDLEKEARKIALKTNINKTKILSLTALMGKILRVPIKFVHISGVFSADGGTQLDLVIRLKSRNADNSMPMSHTCFFWVVHI